MRKIGNEDFQLSPQETQFQEDHKFRQKSDNCVFFPQEFSMPHR